MGKVKYAIVFILASFLAIGQMNAQTLKGEAKQTKVEVKTSAPVTEKTNHTTAPAVKHAPAKVKSENHVIQSDQAKAAGTEKVETNSRSQELKSAPMTPR